MHHTLASSHHSRLPEVMTMHSASQLCAYTSAVYSCIQTTAWDLFGDEGQYQERECTYLPLQLRQRHAVLQGLWSTVNSPSPMQNCAHKSELVRQRLYCWQVPSICGDSDKQGCGLDTG